METHAHHLHKAPGKHFWHYFFEFFMLFLAVFCGFLVENFREERVETHRANELAKSFYSELKSDSTIAVSKIANRIKEENALIYLGEYFKDSSLTNVSKAFSINFLYGIYFRSPSLFEPRTVVLDQLKNSGSLRYFKSEELQKLIGDLSVAIHNINDRQLLETQLRFQYVNQFILNHYDYDFETSLTKNGQLDVFTAISEYEKNNEVIPFHFHGMAKFDKEQAINLMGFFGRAGISATRRIHYKRYTEVNAQLLNLLRNEYHLN